MRSRPYEGRAIILFTESGGVSSPDSKALPGSRLAPSCSAIGSHPWFVSVERTGENVAAINRLQASIDKSFDMEPVPKWNSTEFAGGNLLT